MSDEGPIALLLSDLHLRATTPSARTETCWKTVLEEALSEVWKVSEQHGCIPVIIAGDIFDTWNPSSELVAWAIRVFGSRNANIDVYVIPGQHDLHGHDYENRHKAAYGLLCEFSLCIDLPAEKWRYIHTPIRNQQLVVWACPWDRYKLPESPFIPSDSTNKSSNVTRLLVIHKYLYCGDDRSTHYPQAPEDGDTRRTGGKYEHFDCVLAGDNHIPWLRHTPNFTEKPGIQQGPITLYNHGGFVPQNRDQKDLVPSVGLLYPDGTVGVYGLDVSAPQWAEDEIIVYDSVAGEFIESLGALEEGGVDFMDRLRVAAQAVEHTGTQEALRKIIDGIES